ncbi:hypothetical protein DRO50_01175 [Candidatus Bathyarchaeota archaeon]|nr:MAG: hypothetical protein DRO50_01175 [Candidatus Bathyarchaeota archaeon]
MNSKTITFITLMSTLGNALFAVSFYAGPIAPGVALDFSLLPTFIAGIYGGPFVGLVTGLLAGLLPGVFFGPLGHGAWLGLIGLPLGKGLTGLTSGLISKSLNLKAARHSSLLTVPVVLVSYIPECLFTVAYFVFLMPFFLGSGGPFLLGVVLPKAWGEVILMSVIMGALVGNHGFTSFVAKYLTFKPLMFTRKTEK